MKFFKRYKICLHLANFIVLYKYKEGYMATEKKSAYFRGVARENLKGNWGTAIVVCLVIGAITSLVGVVPFAGTLISLIIAGPLTVAEIRYFSALHKKQKGTVGTAFTDFGKDFSGNVGTYVLESIYAFLWTLLLIIPGIIKSYSYAMSMFLKSKNPNMKSNDAITLSRKIMDGKKAKLFWLDLSFIGWIILCVLTLFIGFIFLAPYMSAARIAFYEEALADYQEKNGNVVEEEEAKPVVDADNQIEVE